MRGARCATRTSWARARSRAIARCESTPTPAACAAGSRRTRRRPFSTDGSAPRWTGGSGCDSELARGSREGSAADGTRSPTAARDGRDAGLGWHDRRGRSCRTARRRFAATATRQSSRRIRATSSSVTSGFVTTQSPPMSRAWSRSSSRARRVMNSTGVWMPCARQRAHSSNPSISARFMSSTTTSGVKRGIRVWAETPSPTNRTSKPARSNAPRSCDFTSSSLSATSARTLLFLSTVIVVTASSGPG